MVSSVELTNFRKRVETLAHELADAHAAMRRQQLSTEVGQSVYRAKNMAYGLLRELETTELKEIFNLQQRHSFTQKLRRFFSV